MFLLSFLNHAFAWCFSSQDPAAGGPEAQAAAAAAIAAAGGDPYAAGAGGGAGVLALDSELPMQDIPLPGPLPGSPYAGYVYGPVR